MFTTLTSQLNHGITFSKDGKTLYASSTDKVFSWSYDSKAVTVSKENRTLITNMTNTDHTTRTLLMSEKKPGTLLVSRGSKENVDKDAADIKSGHSQIRSFDVSKEGDEQDFMDGELLGWGLRNSVGVVEHPDSGGIWAVENSVDQLERKGKDIHQDNPAEELNYLGTVEKPDGGNHGYPLCLSVWQTKDFPELGKLKTGDQFPVDDEKDVTNDMCNSKYKTPRLVFQAHTAPLDIKFDKDASNAYIAFHGSCKFHFTSYHSLLTSQGTDPTPLVTKSPASLSAKTANPPPPRTAWTLRRTSSPTPTHPSAPTAVSVPLVSHGTPRAVCGSAQIALARCL